MRITFYFDEKPYSADLSRGKSISIPLRNGAGNPKCFGAPDPLFDPVRAGGWVGDTREGSSVNFYDIRVNPHGNGTHTECVGHIAGERYFLRDCLQKSHFFALLVSLKPQKIDKEDKVITRKQIEQVLQKHGKLPEAIILRTLPNTSKKLEKNYSNTNPPYLEAEAVALLVESGVEHLLLDLPSVDREEDGGLLAAHKAFWRYPSDEVRKNATITEMVFVPSDIPDDIYLLNLQVLDIELDASPSRPVLFPLVT